MFKVMIVDDEPLVRLAVRSLVNWEEAGFSMETEASNGKQALALLEAHPDTDIVITDINMPVASGLELISNMRAAGMKQEVVVLSAYQDYELVRQAFRLGVRDYVLKTEMEPEGLLQTLQNLSRHCVKTPESAGIMGIQREMILTGLLEQGASLVLTDMTAQAGLFSGCRTFVVCDLWVDDFRVIEEKYADNSLKAFTQAVGQAIGQVLTETRSGESLTLTPQEYLMILGFPEVSRTQVRERVLDIAGRVKSALKHYVNIQVSVGVSDSGSGLESLRGLFQQARDHVRMRFVLGKGRTIFPEQVQTAVPSNHERMLGKEADFIRALREHDRAGVMLELEKLIARIRVREGGIEQAYTNYMELVFITMNCLNEMGQSVEDVFGTDIDFYTKIRRYETQEELNTWLRNMMAWVVNDLEEAAGGVRVSRTVHRARDYILRHYADSSLSLKQVSENVQLSESHLSTLFTRELGETFTDFLTRTRIGKARELIQNSGLKIYEVCELVGYTNSEHFSRMFKKVTGVSPKECKKN